VCMLIASTPTPRMFTRARISAALCEAKRSVRAIPSKHGGNSAQHDADVEPEGPVLDVLAVEADHLLEIDHAAATAHLPQSGNARLGAQAAEVVGFVVFEVGFEKRSRADEGHVAAQNVPDLWQLVETPASQEVPHSRY